MGRSESPAGHEDEESHLSPRPTGSGFTFLLGASLGFLCKSGIIGFCGLSCGIYNKQLTFPVLCVHLLSCPRSSPLCCIQAVRLHRLPRQEPPLLPARGGKRPSHLL